MTQFAFGTGALYAVRTDISPTTPLRFGALQDVQLEARQLRAVHPEAGRRKP